MKVSYYPGCSLHATGREYDESVKAVSKALDIELNEIDDWSCCGASSAHMTNFKLSVALPARNIIAAEKDELDVMVPCAACFNRFKSAQYHLGNDEALRAEVEGIIGEEYKGTVAVRNPIDIIYNDIGVDKLSEVVTKKLEGLKPVSYYGCLLLRPPEVCEFDDYENPTIMDALMTSLGAESRKWSCKTDCCGGSLTLGKTEIVKRLIDRLMTMAREAGANCIVTACPVCFANLDTRASENVVLPAFYFTELIALALGLDGSDAWFKMHNVDPRPLLSSLGLI
ncbi:MAG: CoB--CoM heterodisulfide reductase iron-sulfur subunit B family protein [Deltaproteobacteria bacterium]|nr:CoB--CoM heterodisulfide reductase iron-sulfur subunit B family protein [Deltaproteobacteria bacterium]MBN2844761.1 CoB--CoM heterodisulfide reductase iron-sulfur subunit B family protein [Deltaproteobacteria bacterium]